MTKTIEQEIRERLERAVAPIDPIAPPLDALRARAVKLRRFRISAGGGLLAAAAAAVTVAVVVVPASGSSRVHVAAVPSQASLTSYAAAQHGKHVSGPIADGTHYVGAYSTKNGLQVVRYRNGAWHADSKPVTKYDPVIKIADAGDVIPGHVGFAVRTEGGDVSYFGGVLYDAQGKWTPAQFAKCQGHKSLSCAYAGPGEPYGHVVGETFVSIHNNCKPYCAAGTDYKVTWRWYAPKQEFEAAQIVKQKT